MKKRPNKRRHKRSTGSSSGQVREKLSRLSRELHGDASEVDGSAETVELAYDELNVEPASPARRQAPEPLPAVPLTGEDSGPTLRGMVVGLSSGACRIASACEIYSCILPSRLAAHQQAAIAVGDEVTFVPHGAEHRLVDVLPRRTVLSRPDPQNPRRERVIAANADVVCIVVSIKQPPLRPALIDRYLIACQRGGARTILVVNKVDLATHLPAEQHAVIETYVEMGIQVLRCSASTGAGIDDLRTALAGCTTVFVGHSGVGKSSLLNALAPDLELTTGAVDRRHARGRHTTTRSQLFLIEGGIRLIDTPGIRELGLWHLEAAELRFFFPDFSQLAAGCRFSNCSHIHEPDCAIRAAAADGSLDRGRYATYRRIYEDLGDKGRR
jgi:ribosome biogenesis GTPase